MNDIELVWRQTKYEDHPQRAHTTVDSLGESVGRAMTQQRDRIRGAAKNLAQAAERPNCAATPGQAAPDQ
ncbi:hypothetical protein ACIBCO_40840 [Streptomyces violascens]|uniref:hypothetical protein n=1 Tax=Streptomyces violascens TaxID=67381 RepID=UPI0037A94D7D